MGIFKLVVGSSTQNEKIITTNEKWETCIFRSNTEQEYKVKVCGCGTMATKKGFVCELLGIKGLTPNICATCSSFKAKSS